MTLFYKYRLYVPVIIVFAFILYHQTLRNEFVYDDMTLIMDNAFIHDFTNLSHNLFNPEYFTISGSNTYRPVATFTYYTGYYFFGDNPTGYHVINILFHGFNAILVLLIAYKLSRQRWIALIASVIYVSHPAISEAVVLITFNDDIIQATFFLLSFYLYIQQKPKLIPIILITFILALFTKEMAVTLPVIFILYDLTLNHNFGEPSFKGRLIQAIKSRWPVYSLFLLMSIVFIVFRFTSQQIPAPMFTEVDVAEGFLTRLLYIPYQILQFLKIIFFPLILNADRIHHYPTAYYAIENIIALLVFFLIMAFLLISVRRNRFITFGILWFLITLAPVLNVVPLAHPVAERFLYLPAVGFSMVISSILFSLPRNIVSLREAHWFNLKNMVVIILVLLYSSRTIARTYDWKDSNTIWTKTLKLSPDSYRALNNIGNVYLKNGQVDRSIDAFSQAIELNPKLEKARLNIGNAYLQKKMYKEAIESYKMAIDNNPKFIEAYMNLGVVYAILNKYPTAIKEWEKVLEIEPGHQGAVENIEKARRRMN